MLKQVQHDAKYGVSITGYEVSRREPAQQFKVLLQLRKLSKHRLLEAPHSVIPNLFRDLYFWRRGRW